MGFSHLASFAEGSSNANGWTTVTSFDSTNADLLTVVVSYLDVGGGAPTLSDNKGNTFVPRTVYNRSFYSIRIYYVASPTVGTGHTFTLSGANTYPAIVVRAFAGSSASPYVAENGGSSALTSASTGAVLPGGDDRLFISGLGSFGSITGIGVTAGYTVTSTAKTATASVVGGAYRIQTYAATQSVTWTWTTSADTAVTLAAFRSGVMGSFWEEPSRRGNREIWRDVVFT